LKQRRNSMTARLTLFATAALLTVTCAPKAQTGDIDYRLEMVQFVQRIAERARKVDPDFGVFPQNGADLGQNADYLAAVTGIGQEDIYYGYNADGRPTPAGVTAALETELDRFTAANRLVLTIDYPFTSQKKPDFTQPTREKIDDAYAKSQAKGYVPYATVRNLNYLTLNPGHEPSPNQPPIVSWSDVKEFGYQLQPKGKQRRKAFLKKVGSSGFDLFVTDYSFDGSDRRRYTTQEIADVKLQLGGKVVAYLSIGEAETYRYYWEKKWDRNRDGLPDPGAPSWLERENPQWKGNFKVRYWDPEWQAVIFGYLDKLLNQGFDGVYLDIIDAYEYFER
jgi:cysteinyl-tRNA synthetase, unknown class